MLAILTILAVVLFFVPVNAGSASSAAAVNNNNGFSEKVKVTSLEAKDGRVFTDPQRICDACGTSAKRFFLSATIKNNSPELQQQPFVVIMEIRDQGGINICNFSWENWTRVQHPALRFHRILQGQESLNLLRSFVTSDLNRPEILSNVHSTAVRVSQGLLWHRTTPVPPLSASCHRATKLKQRKLLQLFAGLEPVLLWVFVVHDDDVLCLCL